MRHPTLRHLGVALIGLMALGCGGPNAAPDPGGPTDATPSDAAPSDARPDAAPPVPDRGASADDRGMRPDGGVDGVPPGPPLPVPPAPGMAEGRRVASATVCAECHSNSVDADAMRDAAGARIAPFDLWQGTMMANAARDPLWRAMVSAEVAATPAAAEAIEATCMRCHAPMGVIEAGDGDGRPAIAMLSADSAEGELARDGVSCTACHGITPEGLGSAASFTGGYVIDDDRRLYGPYADPHGMPMQRFAGFEPVQSDHVRDAELCGSCHTLITDSLTPAGQPTGHRLVEQATYLEWRNSRFAPDGVECAVCHMPGTEPDGRPVSTQIARNPGGMDFPFAEPRSPFGRHIFVGANVLVPAILRDNADALRPLASRDAFDATLAATRALLAEAARLEVTAQRNGAALAIRVAVENRAGHKLPSGFPSRRAWLALTVRGPDGVIFRSGGFDDRGRLVDGRGAVLPGERAGAPLTPHGLTIDDEGTVALFESVMCDPDGQPTWTLLRGARFCRDTRILPAGWRADHADADATAPVDVALGEAFGPGRAVVGYRVAAPAAGGPYTVEATLQHQVLGARFAAELFTVDTAEVRAFRGYYEAADARPSTLAEARLVVGE